MHCLLIYSNGSKYKVAAAAVINKDVFLLDSEMKRLYFQPKQWQLNLYTYITQEKLNCCLKLLFSSFLTVLKNNCWVFFIFFLQFKTVHMLTVLKTDKTGGILAVHFICINCFPQFDILVNSCYLFTLYICWVFLLIAVWHEVMVKWKQLKIPTCITVVSFRS